MENIEERLHRLEAADCKVSGFTIDNAAPEHQDKFIELLSLATNLEVLALTRLQSLDEIKDEWLRKQAKYYRQEKKIDVNSERTAYFYTQTLPKLLNILPHLSSLRELYLFNIELSEQQRDIIPKNLNLLT